MENEAAREDLQWLSVTLDRERLCDRRTSKAREGVREGRARRMGVNPGSLEEAIVVVVGQSQRTSRDESKTTSSTEIRPF